MLISPPFLQATASQEIDTISGDVMALGEKTGKGAFPVSHHFGWHGGVHLTAPGAPGNPEPVRAIADGEVVFARDSAPIPLDASPAHPLLYYTGWTSNGVMVLKHTTEIGEDLNVIFYSIYQHLHTLENKAGTQAKLKAGDKVYRKEPIGKAGVIYGRAHCIHFEIVTDEENVEKLMGRSQGPLVAIEGRRNSVWGDMHIVLPMGTPLYQKDPRTETKPYTVRLFNSALGASNDTLESVAQRFNTTPKRIRQLNGPPARAANWWSTLTGAAQKAQNKPEPTVAKRTIQIPAIHGAAAATPPEGISAEEWRNWQAAVVGYTSTPLIVSLSEALGTITLTTRQGNGTITGSCTEKNGGYDLYKTAVKAYPGCPSAGYEMLRFGRVIGPDAPAESDLLDGRLPHFRRIAVPGTPPAFVNLNIAGVQAFSDADFPHWLGWTFIDDDTDGNSRCDSTQLVDLIEPPVPAPIQVAMLEAPGESAISANTSTQYKDRLLRAYLKLQSGAMRERLSYCVVKQPTEWSREDFDNRWRWVKDTPSTLPAHVLFEEHLSSDAYERLKQHHQALAFWEEATAAGLALDKVHYHFHPIRFIQTFKKCGWRGLNELAQTLPRRSSPNAGGDISWSSARGRWTLGNNSDGAMPASMNISINRMWVKYGFVTPLRQSHFLSQIYKETGALKSTIENGGERYFRTMYETLTPEEAEEDFDNKQGWLQAMGFLKDRDRPTYVSQRPGEISAKAQSLGNTEIGDGPRFRGRGLIHLTGRKSYRNYEIFRNTDFTTALNPSLIATDSFSASDSAGYFWICKQMISANVGAHSSGMNIHRRADLGRGEANVSAVTTPVNGGSAGLNERQEFFNYIYFILSDDTSFPQNLSIERQTEN